MYVYVYVCIYIYIYIHTPISCILYIKKLCWRRRGRRPIVPGPCDGTSHAVKVLF